MSIRIKTKIGGFETSYSLDDELDKIIVKAPYLDKDDENDELHILHNIFEVKDGQKADFIRIFFDRDSSVIINGNTPYELDDILIDAVDPPEEMIPDLNSLI